MNSVTGGQSTEDKQRQTVADLARKKVMGAFHQGENSVANQNLANVAPTRVISSTEYNQNLSHQNLKNPTSLNSDTSTTTKPSKNSLFNLISKVQKKLKDLTETTETYAKNSFKHPSTEVSKLQTSTNATTNQPSLTDRPVYQNFATQKSPATSNPFRRTYQIQTGTNRYNPYQNQNSVKQTFNSQAPASSSNTTGNYATNHQTYAAQPNTQYNSQYNYQTQPTGGEIGSLKQAPINMNQKVDWQNYHSAWQNYYQKYYSEYYAKAAKSYVETEKTELNNQYEKRNQIGQLALDSQKRLIENLKNPKSKSLETTEQNSETSQAKSAETPPSLESIHVKTIEATLKERIQKKASSSFQLSKKHRKFIPIFAGVFTVLFVLFLQYNRLIFAPIMAYIAPGNSNDTEITAIDPTITTAPTADPKLIIPKLNVDVPAHFNIANDTATIDNAMNHGVAQFKIPGADALPGQVGNLVISGHSAGDIYSNNQYKFIFSGLERLQDNDLIYVNYNSVRYTYKVTKKQTVEPTDVAALVYPTSKPILTLITCTPLGSDRYRLLVTAEQVSPTYEEKAVSTPTTTDSTTALPGNNTSSELPANEKPFFQKIWGFLTNNH